jgi:hypothetical protein
MLLLHIDFAYSTSSNLKLFYGEHHAINIYQIGYHVNKGCKEML